MQGFGPQSPFFVTLALVAFVMMIRIGMTKKALAPRRVPRTCHGCGHRFTGRTCPRCTT